tara:strand:+ start:365 stop:622 length:258 start_codon:yes stop_codon:yes gene_type:complete
MKTKLIQLVLLAVAGYSFTLCIELGNKYEYDLGTYYPVLDKKRQRLFNKPTDIASQSGFNGGALGMGIICASSLIGIVLLETKKN